MNKFKRNMKKGLNGKGEKRMIMKINTRNERVKMRRKKQKNGGDFKCGVVQWVS
jgi:hypothetical protein